MFQIDRFGRTPIYEQIIDQTQRLIASGILKEGDQLPSVRVLSQELSVNPNTLQKAYSELERRGLCVSAPGNGRFVTPDAFRLVGEGLKGQLEEILRIASELCAAGMPLERVLGVVATAYGKEKLA
ncbi:HTH-type transcriptional repressor YtrA [bioreactor metagenome]|uniref:HTH-type transcriptional repressor YtrA n=1 Tax=bioreactor metagenome TaxID=1076179 RepID=A0A645AEY1_9ZZZZ